MVNSLKHWVAPKGDKFETTFSRLKSAWGKAVTEYSQSKGDWVASWVDKDTILVFSSIQKAGSQKLRMSDLQACIQKLVGDLQLGMETLFPSNMAFPNSHVHKFFDQPTGEVFFLDTQHSQKILSPLLQDFENGYKDLLASSDSVDHWLDKAQKILHLLSAALLICGGRIPRMDAFKSCRIRGSHRNIFHMSGSPVWADNGSNELCSYPPGIAWPLYLYIGVIRPFTMKIFKAKGLLSDLGKLSEYLYVDVFPLISKKRLWTRGNIDSVIREFFGEPLGLELCHNDLCQILQFIIRTHISPGISAQPQFHQGVYNTMANHTDHTAGKYYAIDDLSNLAADRSQTMHFLAISRAFHTWCELVPPSQVLPPTGSLFSTLSSAHIKAAYQCASLAIAMRYKLNCSDEVVLQHQLEGVISSWKRTWFSLQHRKGDFPSSEDEVLMKVLVTLLCNTQAVDYECVDLSTSLRKELVTVALVFVSAILYKVFPLY